MPELIMIGIGIVALLVAVTQILRIIIRFTNWLDPCFKENDENPNKDPEPEIEPEIEPV